MFAVVVYLSVLLVALVLVVHSIGWENIQLNRLQELGLTWLRMSDGYDQDNAYISVRGGEVAYIIERRLLRRHVQYRIGDPALIELGRFWSILGTRRAIARNFVSILETSRDYVYPEEH